MSRRNILNDLEDLAKQLDIKIRYEKTNARGGLCRHNGKYQIIIDRKASEELRLSILSNAVKSFNLAGIFISPKLREFLEI